jgi:hypothetical protein
MGIQNEGKEGTIPQHLQGEPTEVCDSRAGTISVPRNKVKLQENFTGGQESVIV